MVHRSATAIANRNTVGRSRRREALLLQRDGETRFSVEILQLRIIPFEKRLQSINDLEVYTPKVIAIGAFRQAIYHFLLVACCYCVSI